MNYCANLFSQLICLQYICTCLTNCFQGADIVSSISIESGYISKTNVVDGDQFDVEIQVTVPPSSGQELMNISFTPVRKVNYIQWANKV